MLALKHHFARHGATVLLLDDLTTDTADKTIHSIAHGVIRLEDSMPAYGAERRTLRVLKYRGRAFRGGSHDFAIRTGGVEVFPRLVAAEHRQGHARARRGSGVAALDGLLGGGLEQGTSTLILGPAGSGKSLLTLQFAMAAVDRGERAALFVFDEELGLLFDRSRAMGFELEAARDAGALFVEQVDAAELSPGEFTHKVRRSLADGGVKVVVIDSLNGYQAAMPEANSLVLHLHELLQYLNRRGVTTFLTVAQHGLVGQMDSPVDVTYLADTVILLRYFEAMGEVRRAISVIKKRAGRHEATIRELRIGADGVRLGEPLAAFHGVLTGVPRYVGRDDGPLLERDAAPG
jgi:circadian clock protein KaiC